ncbi:MAG: hypothetical protein ACI865_001634 [Flavobacteriaceae bacterium]|jgi:hypothetical protein
MKHLLIWTIIAAGLNAHAQLGENTTPTYSELIEIYYGLAQEHSEIELFQMGQSDAGIPIFLCVINGDQDSLKTFVKAKKETTILINNGIHPGEPDGINACLIWINEWIDKGKKVRGLPVIAIIPAYNVGGMLNRSSSSRANQNGPDYYGFRGNTQNLDLNRDFIKMDSKNMFTFARIFHGLDPDIFIDTHVSNGADYQYTLTYIASVKERAAPSVAKLTHDVLIPFLESDLKKKKIDIIPYVNLVGDVPEKGMSVFNDLPRYSMGYASLFNTISFTVETHMLKPFKERTQATLEFLKSTIEWTSKNQSYIEMARSEAFRRDRSLSVMPYKYALTDEPDSILFKGYQFSYPKSEVTGHERLKYHEDQPYEKYIPYFHNYEAMDTLEIPLSYIIGGQCSDVIERLRANGVEMQETDASLEYAYEQYKVVKYSSGNSPYEGHFLHREVETELTSDAAFQLKPTDVLITTNQRNRRFILSVLAPEMADSYFAWNFFDAYVQQKEHFSSYVFEDKALEILTDNPVLKAEFEAKKLTDEEFRGNPRAQLNFIYQHSDCYEPTHNMLPILINKR